MMENTTLHLHKQNFKFSAAHFLIFDDQHAEKLHGHNYQVAVDLTVPPEAPVATAKTGSSQDRGYFVDFNVFKKHIKARLDEWDEHVLLPAQHKDMKIRPIGPGLDVHFRDRHYVFPASEVVLLAVTNTSVEQLSRILASEFLAAFQKYGVQRVRVRVEETRGQGASTVCSQK